MQKSSFCLLLVLMVSTFAQAQKNEEKALQAVVREFFEGLSDLSESRIRPTVTSDFQLLEDGAVWNLDSLTSKFGRFKEAKFERKNSFQFIRSRQKGSMAWVSYYNEAAITVDERPFGIKWLESAVLIKENGKWRIQLLHSTPMTGR